MTPHIALLRALNVGGRSVKMDALRALFDELGLPSARTLLQSGNVVFDAAGADAALEARPEGAFAERFGFEADFIVRSAAEWTRAIAANPFAAEAKADPAHLLLMPLKTTPNGVLDWPGPERAVVQGRDLYLVYPDGIGRSKLTIALIEKRLGVRGTGRNWNTVLKLGEMLADGRG